MGRKPQPVEVVTADEAGQHELSERVQAALGELAAAAGGVMEEEVVDVVGPRSKPDSACVADRHGGSLGIS